jgi:tetratricopeptide (TPR) repeat protein
LIQTSHLFLKDTTQTSLLTQIIRTAFSEEAYEFIESFLIKLLKKLPQSADIHWLLFLARRSLAKTDLAAESLKQLLILHSHPTLEMFEAIHPVLLIAMNQAQHDFAIGQLERGIKLYPHAHKLYSYLAEFIQLRVDNTSAKELLKLAIELFPEDAILQTEYALCCFKNASISELNSAYSFYRERFRTESMKESHFDCPLPLWKGENLTGKKLLIWAEQGIGDIIMWAGLLHAPLFQECTITVLCYPKLIPLLTRSFPNITWLERFQSYHEEISLRGYDFHLPMADLMLHVLPHFKPAQHPPYLIADTQRAKNLRNKYLQQSQSASKLIGISWGTAMDATAYRRNIPIEYFAPIAKEAGGTACEPAI